MELLEARPLVSTADRNDLAGALAWAEEQLGWRPVDQGLCGDLSPRRYRRLEGSGCLLASHPPDDLASLRRFVVTTALLEGGGVRVPRVVAVDAAAGWMLVEDLGPHTLYEANLSPVELEHVVGRAAAAAGRIRGLVLPAGQLLGPLDAACLLAEIDKTLLVALGPLGYLESAREGAFRDSIRALCERIASALEPAHRDFMLRNLVALGEDVGVLDHQDLRLAPVGYDLASLLVDSIALPADVRMRVEAALIGPELRPQWAGVAAQRCLKIIGTFVGFADRGVDRHLGLCPGAFQQLARVAREVAELEPWLATFEGWAERAASEPRFQRTGATDGAVVC